MFVGFKTMADGWSALKKRKRSTSSPRRPLSRRIHSAFAWLVRFYLTKAKAAMSAGSGENIRAPRSDEEPLGKEPRSVRLWFGRLSRNVVTLKLRRFLGFGRLLACIRIRSWLIRCRLSPLQCRTSGSAFFSAGKCTGSRCPGV